MKTSKFVLFAALLGASAAWADNDSGLYLGGGIGQFNIEGDVDNVNFEGDDDAYKLFVGWRLNKFISFEFDYIDFGTASDSNAGLNINADVKGYAPYVIGTLPLGPFELFAKAGYLFYDFDVEVEGLGSDDSSDEDLVYGVGAGLTLFEHLHARVEYEIIDIGEADDADAIWLSAAWRF